MTTGFEDPRDVLRRHGLRAKRRFSQNFLVDARVVRAIATGAGPLEGRRVTELGPGLGTLTGALLDVGATVHAVERDRDMLAVLREEFAGAIADGRLELVEGDAATTRFEPGATLFGNLPYAITGAIARNLTQQRASVGGAVLMVQREVAKRWGASPGTKAYGAATVFMSAAFEVHDVLDVPPGAFHPPPKVSSAVVRLVPRDPPLAEETPALKRIVAAAFGQRRKTLRNSLKSVTDDPVALLESVGIDPGLRGETLDVPTFRRLAEQLERLEERNDLESGDRRA